MTWQFITISYCLMTGGLILLPLNCLGESADGNEHGGIEMGSNIPNCDDGKWHVEIDWDNKTDYEYSCQPNENWDFSTKVENKTECIPKKDMPPPLHICMNKDITYTDIPPRGGSHRPSWPMYGEYLYCPPQRWVHSLEHGAAVFLYHPCADMEQLKQFKNLARHCLRKHIITPYRHPDWDKQFAVLTYGCKLEMNDFNKDKAVKFIKTHALTAPEHTPRDGSYSYGLVHHASVVWDFQDSKLCPTPEQVRNLEKDILLYKKMSEEVNKLRKEFGEVQSVRKKRDE